MAPPDDATDTEAGTGRGARPAIVAHRGFAGVYPENTLAAMRWATGRGPVPRAADGVELDVVAGADGEPLVFHDRTPDRLTDATGALADTPIWAIPPGRRRRLSVLDSGERIPELGAALRAIPSDVRVNLELKNPGTDEVEPGVALPDEARPGAIDRWRPFVSRVLDVTDDHPHDLLLSSFCEGAIAASRDLAPGLPAAPIFRDDSAAGLSIARRYDCEAIHPAARLIADGPASAGDDDPPVDPRRVAEDSGRELNVWTVRTGHEARALARAGVDGLIADYPDLLRYRPAGP